LEEEIFSVSVDGDLLDFGDVDLRCRCASDGSHDFDISWVSVGGDCCRDLDLVWVSVTVGSGFSRDADF